MSEFEDSLRHLCVLCVSGVSVLNLVFTGEAQEIAETTQRKTEIRTRRT